ncbi:tail fiber domain-containing protein [Citrobacter freundii]|uniref:tail fiber domain-containing protein n=1 Tax=Citrobacter freundii TaxID=546 RepID=UPI0015EACD7E|nr:tail fiber domain-containing protein [Citrobacter freundii]
MFRRGVGVSFIRRQFNGSSTNQTVISLPNTAGAISVQGTSGRDYKDSIVLADSAEAMARIMGIELVNFVYKDDEQRRQRFGFIAEDAEQVAPQYIKHNQFPVEGSEVFDDEGNKVSEEYRDRPSVDVNPIVMDLLGAIQYQQKMITEMAESIKTLESRLT